MRSSRNRARGSHARSGRFQRGLGATGLGITLGMLVAGPGPALGQPREASGGYWRDADAEGHYRARILDADDGSRLRIEWVARGPEGERVLASVTLSDLGGGGAWRLVNPELRSAGDRTLLELSAHDPRTDTRRTLTVELGAPGDYRLRDP